MLDATVICQWFLLCPNPADGLVEHPVLVEVPCCDRCAERMEQTFIRCDICGERKTPDDEWGEFVDPCTNDPSSATDTVDDHMLGHAQCGINHGYEMA